MTDLATVLAGAEAWSAPGTDDRAGTAVVLIHGFTGNPKATRPLAEALNQAGFSVDAIRLPGHGTTPREMGTTRWSDWRTAVTHAVDRGLRDHDRVILLGHSMGATLTLDLAGHRDDLAAAVLINPLIAPPPNPLAKVAPYLQYVIPMVTRSMAGMPTDDIARPDVTEDAYAKVSTKATQSLLDALEGVRAGLGNVTVPVLLVSSRVDHTVQPVNGDILMAELGSDQVQRVILERSWHVPQLDWDRDEVEEAVRTFVIQIHEAATAAV